LPEQKEGREKEREIDKSRIVCSKNHHWKRERENPGGGKKAVII
jgi:hypothetical protein